MKGFESPIMQWIIILCSYFKHLCKVNRIASILSIHGWIKSRLYYISSSTTWHIMVISLIPTFIGSITMPIIIAKVLLKSLMVSVGAFKNSIGIFNHSSTTDDLTLMVEPWSIITLLVIRESTLATIYKARCFGLLGSECWISYWKKVMLGLVELWTTL